MINFMNIRKIVIHFMYECWGIPTDLYSDHAYFTPNQVKFIRKPEKSCKHNCRIEYSYNPLQKCFDKNTFEPSEYFDDFNKLCEAAEFLIGKTIYQHICDAIPASLDIYYEDGRIVNIKLHTNEKCDALDTIAAIAKKYSPDLFI